MNRFEYICKRLNECKKCTKENKIVCVKFILEQEIKGDRNEFLRIKAECQDGDHNTYITTMTVYASLLISLYSMLLTLLNGIYPVLGGFLATLAGLFSLYSMQRITKYAHVKIWRKHISVVLEEIDKDIK